MRTVIVKFSARVSGKNRNVIVNIPDRKGLFDDCGDKAYRNWISCGLIDHLPDFSEYISKKMKRSVMLKSLDAIEVMSDLDLSGFH